MTRTSRAAAALAVAALLALGAAGCGGSRGGGDLPPSIHGTADEQAARLYERLERDSRYQRDVQVIDTVHSLLDYHPDFARLDTALAMGVQAALRLDDPERALALTDERLRRRGDRPAAAPLLLQAAGLAVAARDTLRAVDYLVRAGAADPEAVDETVLGGASPLFAALDAEQLATLAGRHPDAPLRPYLDYERTRRLVLTGRADEAARVVAALEAAAPGSRWTREARAVLESPDQARPRARRLGPAAVRPDLVGVMVPLTGRYAVLGNAVVDAVLLAADAVAAETGVRCELLLEDSGGDPVPAALAARRLCADEGCVALLGALTSAPTAAVALVADRYGVPLVSPTATSDRLWELGAGVFQTNLTSVHDARVLADLAVHLLLKQRFAILYPDNPEGERQAELFRGEVEQRGGRIVAAVPFAERATDFRGPILEVRELRPEVIFVPASVDQMALLGPQLDFHRAGALILGPSGFKSERLLERTGPVLEGVMFPDDVALFPAAWMADFTAAWPEDNYPREATALALKAYQAARLLLDTIARAGAPDRSGLTLALQRRLASRGGREEGPLAFARTVKMVRDGGFAPFPAELFVESWALTEGAAADSLAAGPADSPGAAPTADPFSAGGPDRE